MEEGKESPQAKGDAAPGAAIAAAKRWLASEFSIDSALVGVPKLSRVIGLSPSTIYAHLRSGKFPIRFRVVNKTPLVSLDDLAAWYCAPAPDLLPTQPLPPTDARMPSPEDGEGWLDRLAERAMREVGADPGRRRRRPT